mmetsp:Transcript_33211/g.83466  ORF Transcript_33211/g.83466 Transcript_33211/m.83466 type:complete len:411 (+) Transcript_33211:3005-4237(+)
MRLILEDLNQLEEKVGQLFVAELRDTASGKQAQRGVCEACVQQLESRYRRENGPLGDQCMQLVHTLGVSPAGGLCQFAESHWLLLLAVAAELPAEFLLLAGETIEWIRVHHLEKRKVRRVVVAASACTEDRLGGNTAGHLLELPHQRTIVLGKLKAERERQTIRVLDRRTNRVGWATGPEAKFMQTGFEATIVGGDIKVSPPHRHNISFFQMSSKAFCSRKLGHGFFFDIHKRVDGDTQPRSKRKIPCFEIAHHQPRGPQRHRNWRGSHHRTEMLTTVYHGEFGDVADLGRFKVLHLRKVLLKLVLFGVLQTENTNLERIVYRLNLDCFHSTHLESKSLITAIELLEQLLFHIPASVFFGNKISSLRDQFKGNGKVSLDPMPNNRDRMNGNLWFCHIGLIADCFGHQILG